MCVLCDAENLYDEFAPRPGALRVRDDRGLWITANPGDRLYRYIEPVAEEAYAQGVGWEPIPVTVT